MRIGERWSFSWDRETARRVGIPALEALLPFAVVAIGAIIVRRRVEDAESPTRTLVSWGITVGLALVLWIAGRYLRRTDDGLRVLLAMAAGLSIAGGVILWRALGETFPGNGGNPDTELGMLGLQAMAVALGGLVPAFGIEYRRSDPWYVLAFGVALLPMLVTAGLWFSGLRDATWL